MVVPLKRNGSANVSYKLQTRLSMAIKDIELHEYVTLLGGLR